MTLRSAQPNLLSRDTIGIVYLLLSGTGVVFLPTTAKLAYESGGEVPTVAFTRGIFAGLLLTLAALLAGRNPRRPRALYLHSLVACLGLGFILGLDFSQISLVGIGLGMLAMLSSVVITLLNVRVADSSGSLVSNIYMSLWGALLFGVALLAALFARLIFGETFSPLQWFGFVIVLAALFLFEYLARETR